MAKGAPEQQGGGGDNSLDLLWGAAIFLGAVYASWYFGKAYISAAVFSLKIYEIYIIKFVLDKINFIAGFAGLHIPYGNLDGVLVFIKGNYFSDKISISSVVNVCNSVGVYLRFPLIILMATGAALAEPLIVLDIHLTRNP